MKKMMFKKNHFQKVRISDSSAIIWDREEFFQNLDLTSKNKVWLYNFNIYGTEKPVLRVYAKPQPDNNWICIGSGLYLRLIK